jgi:hypothetical protein
MSSYNTQVNGVHFATSQILRLFNFSSKNKGHELGKVASFYHSLFDVSFTFLDLHSCF